MLYKLSARLTTGCVQIFTTVGVVLWTLFLTVQAKFANDTSPDLFSPVWVIYGAADSFGAVRAFDNPAVLNNLNLTLIFGCLANEELTEWAYDGYPAPESDRNKPRSWNINTAEWANSDGTKIMVEFLHLKFDAVSFEEPFVCRARGNHSNNVLIWLEPDARTNQVYITWERDVAPVVVALAPEERPARDLNSCPIRLLVAELGGRYYMKCKENATVTEKGIGVQKCCASATCANAYQDIKMPEHCASVMHNLTALDLYDWDWESLPPGVTAALLTVCEMEMERERPDSSESKVSVTVRAAWEIFFTGGHMGETPKMHFSLSEIDLRDLIWIDLVFPNETEYVTHDTIETGCHISMYGFAYVLKASVSLNGSKIMNIPFIENSDRPYLESNVTAFDSEPIIVEFAKYGPGSYTIDCSSRVWNTREMVTRTTVIHVGKGIEPYFDSTLVLITFEEGETDRRLTCDALGVPNPDETWEKVNLPGVWVDSSTGELVLDQVSTTWNNYAPIKCTGTSRIGTATKEFKLHINERNGTTEQTGSRQSRAGSKPETKIDTSLPTASIVAIALGIICVTILALGLFYLYFRFSKIHRAVVGQLTSDEVRAFVHGGTLTSPGTMENGDQQRLSVDCLPYNSLFEVPDNEMFIDFSSQLGSGHYGIVYKGQVRTTPVAVKTVRPNVPIEYFKALMSELKILAHIGSHEHIVNLIGANSSNIMNRQLYVGVELCKMPLLKHLRDNQPGAPASSYVSVNTGGSQLEQDGHGVFGRQAHRARRPGRKKCSPFIQHVCQDL